MRIFKAGEFRNTHERLGFEKLVEALQQTKDLGEVVLLVNCTIPDVKYVNPDGKERFYRGVSPDVIVLKEDSVIVLELKDYPGTILFPTTKETMWDPWKTQTESGLVTLNQGMTSNPHSQLVNNKRAVSAFLTEREDSFASASDKGSDFYRSRGIILFTNNDVRFDAPKPSFWRDIDVATLQDPRPDVNIGSLIKAATSGVRMHRHDDRSGITLNRASMEAIAQLLGAKEENPKTIGPRVSAALREVSEKDEISRFVPEKKFTLPTTPLPLRLLSYYRRCVTEEAKRSATFVPNNDTVFIGSGSERLISSLRCEFTLRNSQAMVSAAKEYFYAYGIVKFKGTVNMEYAPLFTVNVQVQRQDAKVTVEALSDTPDVNISALKRLKGFASSSDEEINQEVKEIRAASSDASDFIRRVLRHIGDVNTADELRVDDEPSDLQTVPSGLHMWSVLMETKDGFYVNLLKDLAEIERSWESTLKKSESPADLAWKFLSGISSRELKRTWIPPDLTVVPSNFEQAKAIGMSLLDSNVLQVISGPPGTGKSQVIQNIIANLAFKNKSALFASRNNKAVDVVVDRLNESVLKMPYVLRYGNRNTNAATLQKIQDYAASTSTVAFDARQDDELDRLIRQINARLNGMHVRWQIHLDDIQNIRRIRAAIDELSRQVTESVGRTDYSCHFWQEPQDTTVLENQLQLWRQSYEKYCGLQAVSDSFLKRLITHLDGEVALGAFFTKRRFVEATTTQFLARVGDCLPTNLKVVVLTDVIEHSKTLLPALEELISLNRSLGEYQEQEAEFGSEDDFFKKWREFESMKIKSSLGRFIHKISQHPERWTSPTLRSMDPNNSQLLSEAGFGKLRDLYRCHAITSLSTGKVPMISGLFDVAIIDEASQCDIPSCLPILYRAKRAVVIGDSQQLSPITFDPKKDKTLSYCYRFTPEEFSRYGYSKRSLLDVAKTLTEEALRNEHGFITLLEHYRCDPDIIAVSNNRFYNNQLRPMTVKDDTSGLYWLDVPNADIGLKWKNVAEVNSVISLVKSFRSKQYGNDRIGIVTPFKHQKEAIKDGLKREKLLNDGTSDILVDTAHGFQGDERDVIIFSLVVGRQMIEKYDKQTTVNWMHIENRNLMNVAVTRARKILIVVGDGAFCLQQGGLLKALRIYSKDLPSSLFG